MSVFTDSTAVEQLVLFLSCLFGLGGGGGRWGILLGWCGFFSVGFLNIFSQWHRPWFVNILSMDNSLVFSSWFVSYVLQAIRSYLIKAQAEIHHYKGNVGLCSFLARQSQDGLELFISQQQRLPFLVKYQIIQISQYALVCFRNWYFNQSCRIAWEQFTVPRRKKVAASSTLCSSASSV